MTDARIRELLDRVSLFEIGRNRAEALLTPTDLDLRRGAFLALVIGWIAVAVVLVHVLPAPSMAVARAVLGPAIARRFRRRPYPCHPVTDARGATDPGDTGDGWVYIAGFQFAVLGFALGVLIELPMPMGAPDGRLFAMAGSLPLALTVAAIFTCMYAWLVLDRAEGIVDTPGQRPARANRRRTLARAAALTGLALGTLALLSMISIRMANTPIPREPFALLSGVSAWPSQLLRTLTLVLFAWFVDWAWDAPVRAAARIDSRYFGRDTPPLPSDSLPLKTRLRDLALWPWSPTVAFGPGERAINGAALWHAYRQQFRPGPRFWSIAAWSLTTVLLMIGIVWAVGDVLPALPARGASDRPLFGFTMIATAIALVILLSIVAHSTVLTWRTLRILKQGRTVYPDATRARFALELPASMRTRAVRPIINADRREDGTHPPRNSPLDDWIDIELIAEHSTQVGFLIFLPFVMIALMLIARSQLFDNWYYGPTVLSVFGLLTLLAVVLALLLRDGAERARRQALRNMEADLRTLRARSPKWAALAEPCADLMERVRSMRTGAYAPLLEQPLVRALLVPLGSAGGIQLLELILFARGG